VAAASQVQPFQQHLQELRQRVIAVVVVLCVGAGVGYGFRTDLIRWLSAPLKQDHLYYTSPSGGLQFTLQVCLLAGGLLALPVAVYGLVRFVQPAVQQYAHYLTISRLQTMRFILMSYLLAVAGASFAYWFVLPAAFHFFSGFSSSEVQSFITADKYFSFVLKCITVFAVIFQLPLIFLFINRIKPLSPARLRKYRKWVVIGSFLIALIMPFAYDPVSQLLLAAPIVVLYELSIIMIVVTNRHLKAESDLASVQIPSDISEFNLEPLPLVTSKPLSSVLSTRTPPAAPLKLKPKMQRLTSQPNRRSGNWDFVGTRQPITKRPAHQSPRVVHDIVQKPQFKPLRTLDQSTQQV
jgi:sec-independent protein translocase protein TatC